MNATSRYVRPEARSERSMASLDGVTTPAQSESRLKHPLLLIIGGHELRCGLHGPCGVHAAPL